MRVLVLASSALLLSNGTPASGEVDPTALVLPPTLAWSGASEELIVPSDDPWITPSERDDLASSPSYQEALDWLDRLVRASPRLEQLVIGETHEGREIVMIIASKEGAKTPAELAANGRPTLLAHGGIHAGEIDGKDAGMMILRDLTVAGRIEALDRVNLLFVPVLNPDGHERRSPYSRINQRGPSEMGWRTNARNQNLNRDFAKLDTPEVQSLVRVIERWSPDLYIDLHVTDGIDYQYDITWGYNGAHAWSPSIAGWLDEMFSPKVGARLSEMGHVPGPLVFAVDRRDLSKGIFGWTAGPRFSNGYGDARHLATVLVENHSLKPYRQRVLGTYVLLEASMEALALGGAELRAASERDRSRRLEEIPLGWKVPDREPETMEFLGVEYELRRSSISGGLVTDWLGREKSYTVPVIVPSEPSSSVARANAYWVPSAWAEVIDRLERHGVEIERHDDWTEVEVELYRLSEPEYGDEPFEGRMRVEAKVETERVVRRMPPGSVRVPTDQPLGTLITLLLEPGSADSFFQWGFLLEVLQRTEYAEAYAMEPLAAKMMAEDDSLRVEFEERLLTDADFAGDARERLQWFYEKTPYFDAEWRLYPIGREVGAR